MPARVECEAYSDSSMMGDAPVERGVANGADGTTIPSCFSLLLIELLSRVMPMKELLREFLLPACVQTRVW